MSTRRTSLSHSTVINCQGIVSPLKASPTTRSAECVLSRRIVTRASPTVDRRADESVNHAPAWLKKNGQHPFFFWLHLYDPHSPYDPPEPFRTEYRDHLYDGEIAFADRELGRLMVWLKANRLYDRSIIVFLSDHGYHVGEHELWAKTSNYELDTRVPLLIAAPGIRKNQRTSALVG